jgi:hypothetical protein
MTRRDGAALPRVVSADAVGISTGVRSAERTGESRWPLRRVKLDFPQTFTRSTLKW